MGPACTVMPRESRMVSIAVMRRGFLGWGKPVNTNPSRLRWGLNGLALVALAGPASNVIFAFILALAAVLAFRIAPAFSEYAAKGVQLSLYLAIFNLIPVPP